MQTKSTKDYSGIDELLSSEVLKNYNNFIVSKAIKNSNGTSQVVDFGAGIGTLSVIFRQEFEIDTLCVEIDNTNKKYLSERKLKYFDSIEDIEGKSDLIFSSNVLEHIEDDISALVSMKENLRENGKIYLYLPAKMILWSKMDEDVGHYRRYELSEIKEKCERVGLKVVLIHYADSVGFFASLFIKLVGYNSESFIGSVKSLKFYDKWLFPVSKMLDSVGCKYLFGKNLVVVAM